jgi:ArsR family transcriptional regulator, virulence genes transcriptional regulator
MLKNITLENFATNAAQAAGLMKAMGNEKRLMILCKLVECGEMSVIPMAKAVGLSQSAVSQHLARMRKESLIDFRRDGATIHYFIADKKIGRVLKTLKSLYC